MDNCVALTSRVMQIVSPLPTDVMPNIMLRVEDRQAFSRLACTCHGFYAWSQPWLKSRRAAAALVASPQRLTRAPAWIKTHSRHLHHADWSEIRQQNNAGNHRQAHNESQLWTTFAESTRWQSGQRRPPERKTAHLEFILFSPRLRVDLNSDIAERAAARLKENRDNTANALAGFKPSGAAWERDLLAGATAWLETNAHSLFSAERSSLLNDLSDAMRSFMIAQKSPALSTHLLKYGLSKSHLVHAYFSLRQQTNRWQSPLLTALVSAATRSKPPPGSASACAYLHAIHAVIASLVQRSEIAALEWLVDRLEDVLPLMSANDVASGNEACRWLRALSEAVAHKPQELAMIEAAVTKYCKNSV